jgi:hypothetical protein
MSDNNRSQGLHPWLLGTAPCWAQGETQRHGCLEHCRGVSKEEQYTMSSRPLKDSFCPSPPRKRGSRTTRRIWIPAFAGMTDQAVGGLLEQAANPGPRTPSPDPLSNPFSEDLQHVMCK